MPDRLWMARLEELRQELAEAEGSITFYLQLDEGQALDLASGYVPTSVQAAVMSMLDFKRADERCAARPVPKTKGRALSRRG